MQIPIHNLVVIQDGSNTGITQYFFERPVKHTKGLDQLEPVLQERKGSRVFVHKSHTAMLREINRRDHDLRAAKLGNRIVDIEYDDNPNMYEQTISQDDLGTLDSGVSK